MTNNVFYYFGDDKVFYSNLKGALDHYLQEEVVLKKFFATQESSIQSLFAEVVEGQPDAVLIDFSLHSQDFLHLAEILARTPFEKKIHIIGILDHLKTDSILVEAQATGATLCFIKSDHTKDIAQILLRLVYPGKVADPNYVKVKINETWTTSIIAKVGFISETGIHIETDLKLNRGDVIPLEHFWRNRALVPSKDVIVRNVDERNLVYNFANAIDADFEFVDTFKNPDRTPEEEVKRYNLVEEFKFRFKKSFKKTFTTSQVKRAKVLIFDSQYSIYRDNKRSDRFPFILRCLGSSHWANEQLNRLTPHIVAFSLDDIVNEATIRTVTNWARNQSVMPYLIIFNAQEGAVSDWQTRMGYNQMLVSSGPMDVDLLLKMAQVFESKLKTKDNDENQRMYISKLKEESNCVIEVELEVLHLSESDIIFTSTRRIPVGCNLRIKTPISTLAYVFSEQEQKGVYTYQAILHCHDELEKNSIRRYINAVLFRENEIKVADKKDLVSEDAKLRHILSKSVLKNDD